MTAPQNAESVVREPWATDPPDRLAGELLAARPAKRDSRRRDRIGDGLARKVLARLPLAITVMNAEANLSFWNEQAGLLFAAPPMMAAEQPPLAEMLARVGTLTQPQRDRIVAFARAHIAAGDRTGPDGCLRLSLGHALRIAIEIHGLGTGRWMVVFDDGKVTAAGNPATPASGDAWLDSLTGLSNRRHFNQMLRQALGQATAETRQAVMLIDLDGFASVVNTFGHPVGDGLLCLVAQRLRREIRDGDLLARLGGDEFALLLPSDEGADTLAARAISILAKPFLVEGQRVTISASIGIVSFPDHGTVDDDLMRNAYFALQQAKSAGGRTCRRFDAAMASQFRARRQLETDLRKAMALGEFSLVYQACGDIQSQALTGFEARLRWDHPAQGVLSDLDFMPVGEATGLIVALEQWALQTACSDAVSWPAPLSVAVRLSARRLQDADSLVESLRQALATSRLDAARLILKIPEIALLSREAEGLATLHQLNTLGVGITLVDFAVGPSLISRLQSFPFQGIAFDADDASDLAAIADKANVLRALSAAELNHVDSSCPPTHHGSACHSHLYRPHTRHGPACPGHLSGTVRLGDALTSTSGIEEVVRRHAATNDRQSVAEPGCRAP